MLTLLIALASAGEPPTVRAAPGRGVTVTSADDRFSFQVRTRFQVRAVAETGADEATLLASVRAARLKLDGHVLDPDLGWQVQLGFARQDIKEGSPLLDAWGEWSRHRDGIVRAGQFHIPFDRLRTLSETGLELPDRPLPVSTLALDRDVGITLSSSGLGGSALGYHLGLFGGRGVNPGASGPLGGLALARLELRPLGDIDDDREGDLDRRAEPGLALGAGFAYNRAAMRAGSTTSTPYTLGTIDYVHAAGDAVFKWRGLALEGEVLYRGVHGETALEGPDGAVEYARPGWGWVGQASYAFTPHVQIAGRVARLYARADGDPTFVANTRDHHTEVGGGLNGYVNGHLAKVQAGWTTRLGEAAPEHVVTALVDLSI